MLPRMAFRFNAVSTTRRKREGGGSRGGRERRKEIDCKKLFANNLSMKDTV